MIRSMTGYGRAQMTIDTMSITVELRSVNHRYFEFSSRVPRNYGFLDEKLKSFVKGAKFDRLGVFEYSKEDGTPAERLDGHLEDSIKVQRRNEIMELQNGISKVKNEELIGKTLECKVFEEIDGAYLARSYRDVPNEDGVVIIKADRMCNIGDIVLAKVIDGQDYDLVAELI